MTRYLLDTNIVSNVIKPGPSPGLLSWLALQPNDDLFISALTIAEIWRGVLEKPLGRERSQLQNWFAGPDGPTAVFAGRILPFDEKAGHVWGRLMAHGKTYGKPRDAFDMMIAAIAETHGCVIVTDNEKHFVEIATINPIRGRGV